MFPPVTARFQTPLKIAVKSFLEVFFNKLLKSKLICDSNGLAHLNIFAFLDVESLDNTRSENEAIR